MLQETYVFRTSAVSSTNFGSILIFASCVVGSCKIPGTTKYVWVSFNREGSFFLLLLSFQVRWEKVRYRKSVVRQAALRVPSVHTYICHVEENGIYDKSCAAQHFTTYLHNPDKNTIFIFNLKKI